MINFSIRKVVRKNLTIRVVERLQQNKRGKEMNAEKAFGKETQQIQVPGAGVISHPDAVWINIDPSRPYSKILRNGSGDRPWSKRTNEKMVQVSVDDIVKNGGK